MTITCICLAWHIPFRLDRLLHRSWYSMRVAPKKMINGSNDWSTLSVLPYIRMSRRKTYQSILLMFSDKPNVSLTMGLMTSSNKFSPNTPICLVSSILRRNRKNTADLKDDREKVFKRNIDTVLATKSSHMQFITRIKAATRHSDRDCHTVGKANFECCTNQARTWKNKH